MRVVDIITKKRDGFKLSAIWQHEQWFGAGAGMSRKHSKRGG